MRWGGLSETTGVTASSSARPGNQMQLWCSGNARSLASGYERPDHMIMWAATACHHSNNFSMANQAFSFIFL